MGTEALTAAGPQAGELTVALATFLARPNMPSSTRRATGMTLRLLSGRSLGNRQAGGRL
jgi:hypothetical protein